MFVHVQDSVHASLAYVQKPIRKHKSMQTRVNLCVQIQGHECVEAMHTNIVHLLQVYTCEQAVCVQACVCESLIHVFASPSECVCMHAQVYVCLRLNMKFGGKRIFGYLSVYLDLKTVLYNLFKIGCNFRDFV